MISDPFDDIDLAVDVAEATARDLKQDVAIIASGNPMHYYVVPVVELDTLVEKWQLLFIYDSVGIIYTWGRE